MALTIAYCRFTERGAEPDTDQAEIICWTSKGPTSEIVSLPMRSSTCSSRMLRSRMRLVADFDGTEPSHCSARSLKIMAPSRGSIHPPRWMSISTVARWRSASALVSKVFGAR